MYDITLPNSTRNNGKKRKEHTKLVFGTFLLVRVYILLKGFKRSFINVYSG
jgi:hypothetical protein